MNFCSYFDKKEDLNKEKSIKDLDENDFIHHLSYDSVIFGFNGKQLKILLLEYYNTGLFALPGGFVRKDESLDDAVKKGVKERTGIDNIYLEQFQTFGSMERSDPTAMRRIIEANGLDLNKHEWMFQRFLSIAYYALINYDKVSPKPDALSDSINWFPADNLPPLMMDHAQIAQKALGALRENIEKKLIGMNLLPPKFTMKQLQQVYEAILDKKLRRTTFQRKLLGMDVLDRHEKLFQGKAHKAPYLYSFKTENTEAI